MLPSDTICLRSFLVAVFLFFFQAEDGIRDFHVTGVQTCALPISCGYQASVDEAVEVAFTVSPRVRRIGAHDPHSLPLWDYYKQVFWSSGIDLDPASLKTLTDDVTL